MIKGEDLFMVQTNIQKTIPKLDVIYQAIIGLV